MNSMDFFLSLLYIYIIVTISLVSGEEKLSDFAEPADVAVIEEMNTITIDKTGHMPENIDFKLNLVHGTKPVVLHLHKNDLNNEVKRIAVIRKNKDGRIKVFNQHIPKVKNVAMYQDNTTFATFTVSCEDASFGRCNPILLGSLSIEGTEYEFHPLEEKKTRTKRSVRGRKRWLYAAFKKSRKPCTKADTNINPRPWASMAHKQKQRTAQYNNRKLSDIVAARKIIQEKVQPSGFSRRPREIYHLKLAVFIDYEIYMRWYNASLEKTESLKMQDAKSNIRMYFAHVVNGIDIRYKNIEHSDFQIRVVVSEYIIADHPYAFDWMEEFLHPGPQNTKFFAVRGGLNRFVEWKDIIKDQFPPHDHVMLFTGHDLFEERTNDPTVTGYAHVRTVCTSKSASINEDHGGFGGITTATHELGHSLGANHDGISNPCPGTDQYIMTALGGEITPSNQQNPWKFSSCSVQYFTDYIEELNMKGQNCMREEHMLTHQQEFEAHISTHPGQKFDPNAQCQQILGKASYYGWGGGLGRFEDVCTNMACKNNKTMDSFNLYYAARGTSCGNKRWCIDGACVYDDIAPVKDDACVHGDSQKPIQGGALCSELTASSPANCYKANYSEVCCGSCKKAYTGIRGCEYGDKLPSCMLVKPQPFLCYDPKNEGICCGSCARHYTGIKDCKYGDKKSGCDKRLCHLPDHKTNCCYTCRSNLTTPDIPSLTAIDQTTSPNQVFEPSTIIPKKDIVVDFIQKDTTMKPVPRDVTVSVTADTKPQKQSILISHNCRDDVKCSIRNSFECYNKTHRDACCQTCRNFETGVFACPYGDKDSRCPGLVGSQTKAMCRNYGHICCKSCEKYKQNQHPRRRPIHTNRNTFVNNITKWARKSKSIPSDIVSSSIQLTAPKGGSLVSGNKQRKTINVKFKEVNNISKHSRNQKPSTHDSRHHKIKLMRTLAFILSRLRSALRG